MSNVKSEGTDHYVGWGPNQATVAPPGLGWASTYFPLIPSPQNDIHLDTSKKITMDVWVGGGTAGEIFVTPLLWVDGELLASGEELEGTFVDGGRAAFTWTLTPRLEAIPAGAEVEWEFRLSGAYDQAYYWMDGDQWTAVTLPVVEPPAPEPEPENTTTTTTTTTASSSPSPTSTSTTSTSSSPTPSASPTPSPTSSSPSQGGLAAPPEDDAPAETTPLVALPVVFAALVLLARRRL